MEYSRNADKAHIFVYEGKDQVKMICLPTIHLFFP